MLTRIAIGRGKSAGYDAIADPRHVGSAPRRVNDSWLRRDTILLLSAENLLFEKRITGNVTASLGYGYDDSGLRTSLTANDQRFAPLFMGTGIADYAPNNLNQYATAGGVTQNYDGNGNLLFDGQSTYT